MSGALGDEIDILRFELAGHRFALRLADVREIARAVAPSPLPDAPASVLGTIDVRGTRVPLYDLRARLGLPPAKLRARDALVLVGDGPRRAAIMVDDTLGIERIPADAIAPALRSRGVLDRDRTHRPRGRAGRRPDLNT